MNTTLFIEKLKGIRKTYFSFRDLEKFYPSQKEDLKVVLHRLVKQNKMRRLLRGYYTFNASRVDWEQLSCELIKPSYISFEYALHRHGLIDQIPARVTLVTTKKRREFQLPDQILEYSHINSKLYFGYKVKDNFLIAEKEKALLDELYLISLKKRHLSLESLHLENLNKKLFSEWLKKYPFFTQKLARKLLNLK